MRTYRRATLLVTAALSALLGATAQASTIENFVWVSTSVTGGSETPSGTLQLTLPSSCSITGPTFSCGNASTSAALAEVTGFSFTYSDGATLGLSNLGGSTTLTMSSGDAWATSDQLTPSGASEGYYLISGFEFGGHASGGTWGSATGNFELSDPLSNPTGPLSLDSNNATPGAGGPVAAVDAGYWELQQTSVPLPAGFVLLLSGVTALLLLGRSSIASALCNALRWGRPATG